MLIIKLVRIFAKVGDYFMMPRSKKTSRRYTIYASEIVDNNEINGVSERIKRLLIGKGKKTIVLDLDRTLPANRMRTVKAAKIALESLSPNMKIRDLDRVVVVKYRANPAAGKMYRDMVWDQSLKGGQMIVDKEALKAIQK